MVDEAALDSSIGIAVPDVNQPSKEYYKALEPLFESPYYCLSYFDPTPAELTQLKNLPPTLLRTQLSEASLEDYLGLVKGAICLGSPQQLVTIAPVVAQRYHSDIMVEIDKMFPNGEGYPDDEDWDERYHERIEEDLDRLSGQYFARIANAPDILLDSSSLKQLYHEINNDVKFAPYFLQLANKLPSHSHEVQQFVDRLTHDLVKGLFEEKREKEKKDLYERKEMWGGTQTLRDTMWSIAHTNPEVATKILVEGLLQAENESDMQFFLATVGNAVGFNQLRKELRSYTQYNSSFLPQFESAIAFIGLDRGPKPHVDQISSLYSESDYKNLPRIRDAVNEDVVVLMDKLKGKGPILDVACGPGRDLIAFKQAGVENISGVDLIDVNVELARKALEEQGLSAEVKQGDWFSLPYKDKQFESLYCLGRSVLHNTTVPDYIDCFREFYRVLDDEGVAYVDLPDPTKGDIAKSVAEYESQAQSLGIYNYPKGAMVDSPDNTFFCDRLALNEVQLRAVARFAGFNVQVLARKPYGDTSDKSNENVYYQLNKVTSHKALTEQEKEALYLIALNGSMYGFQARILESIFGKEYVEVLYTPEMAAKYEDADNDLRWEDIF